MLWRAEGGWETRAGDRETRPGSNEIGTLRESGEFQLNLKDEAGRIVEREGMGSGAGKWSR